MQRAAWLATGGIINAEDLDVGAAHIAEMPLPTGTHSAPHPLESGLGQDLKERERELILSTLKSTGGSRKLTAERLGISPRTLRHKLQQLKAAGVAVPQTHDQSFLTVT